MRGAPTPYCRELRHNCVGALLWRALAFPLGCVAVTSCSSDDDPALPPIVAELPRVQYRSETDLSLCPVSPDLVQGRIEVLERTLGVQGPARIIYVHTSTGAQANRLGDCATGALACARGNEIYTSKAIDYHEIAHAVMSATALSPNPLVAEGVATAFDYTSDPAVQTPQAWRDLVGMPIGDTSNTAVYPYGDRLVTRLFDDDGSDKLVALYKAASSSLSADEFAARFAAIYSLALDDVWSSLPQMKYAGVCVGLDDNTDLAGAENNPTPYCPGEIVPARHVWSLDTDTPLAIETTYRQSLLGSCDPTILPTDGQVLFNYAAGDPILSLGRWHQGRYYATPFRADGSESFRMWRGPWLGANCADVTPYRLQSTPARFTLGLPDQQWLALEWTGNAPLNYMAGPGMSIGSDNSSWYVCNACDRTQCQPLSDWGPLTIQPGVTWFFAERGTNVQTEDTWLYVEAAN